MKSKFGLIYIFTRAMGNGSTYTVVHRLEKQEWDDVEIDAQDQLINILQMKYREEYCDCTTYTSNDIFDHVESGIKYEHSL